MEKQIKEKNKRNSQNNIDPFEKALYLAQQKLNNFLDSKNHINSENIMQKVIDENIYVLNSNKNKKYSNFYEILILKKNSEEKNYTIKSTNTIDNKSNKNLSQILRINSNQEKINSNNNENNYPQNDNISNNDEDYLIQNSNEETKQINNNHYLQNFLKQFSKLEGISNKINISNKIDKNLLLNINSNINFNNYNDKNIFIGNKRYLEQKKINEKTEKENIYDEIKRLIDLYNNIIKKNNINDEKENKIYPHKIGFFETTETLIIDGKPTCIVYLNRSIINKIYLIVDEISILQDKEIIDILNNIKNDLSNIVEKIKKFDENE